MDSLDAEGRIEGPVSREGMFLINNLLFLLFTFTVLIGTVFALGARNPWTVVTLAFGGYAAWVTFAEMFMPVSQRIKRGENIGTATTQAIRRGRRRFGGYLVHAGAVIVIVSIA